MTLCNVRMSVKPHKIYFIRITIFVCHKAVKAEIFLGDGSKNRRGAALGSLQPLECEPDLVYLPAGFQANFCLQCIPATTVTSIAFRPSWGV